MATKKSARGTENWKVERPHVSFLAFISSLLNAGDLELAICNTHVSFHPKLAGKWSFQWMKGPEDAPRSRN